MKQKSGGDFLTCGGCRKKYDLSDLTKFVQHKVLDCNKENADISKGNETTKYRECCSKKIFSLDDDDKVGSPRVSGSDDADNDDVKTEMGERKPVVRDSGANTVKSGGLH